MAVRPRNFKSPGLAPDGALRCLCRHDWPVKSQGFCYIESPVSGSSLMDSAYTVPTRAQEGYQNEAHKDRRREIAAT